MNRTRARTTLSISTSAPSDELDQRRLETDRLKEGDQFERGATETYGPLDLHGLQGRLTTDDIVWLRVQKKGIFGITGTPDGSGGAWKLERVRLLVNGTKFAEAHVNRWLDTQHGRVIRVDLRPWSKERRFARTIRMWSTKNSQASMRALRF